MYFTERDALQTSPLRERASHAPSPKLCAVAVGVSRKIVAEPIRRLARLQKSLKRRTLLQAPSARVRQRNWETNPCAPE